ncbi:MAG: hypothetical protein II364_04370 [Bacteroidales bacterium]|nr:hypothetical protein [Bacteroidales bacterium]
MKGIKLFSAALLALATVACSSPKKMAEQAENVLVACQPETLEVVAGNVNVEVAVTYPADYFLPDVYLKVTPVVVYEGGEYKLDELTYQGEKVQDNYKVVPTAGGVVTEKLSFPFKEGMEKCYLELRGVVSKGKQSVELPSKKAADGCNTTCTLVCKKGKVDYKADNYKEIIYENPEAQILYTINSSVVRGKELRGQSVKDFQAALDEANANERKTITGVEVVAYASPDGKEAQNDKLSDNRSKSAEKAFAKVAKGKNVTTSGVKSVGEDWEGFQELVAESNIEDKDLIIRVLSMYSDPAVREKEIKNMSAVYKSLAKEVLPELRRARFIATVENKNFTAEELNVLVEENIDVLDEEALLRAASLKKNDADRVAIYKKAIEKFASARAQYNLAVAYFKGGDLAAAKAEADKCAKDADVNNLLGVLALNNNDVDAAEAFFAASGNATSKENMAVVNVLKGDYAAAANNLAAVKKSYNKALVCVLNGNYAAAAEAVCCCDCACNAYLKAVIAARQGKAEEVKTNLEAAKKDAKLAARAEKDIEFAQFN